MHKLLAQRLAIAWIAIVGVLFGALAPAISHAMAAPAFAPPGEEVQVCTQAGMKTIVLAGTPSGKSSAPLPDHMCKQCACCPAHGASFLPSAPAFAFPLPPLAGSHPPLFYQSTTPLFAWTSPSPRGPPALI